MTLAELFEGLKENANPSIAATAELAGSIQFELPTLGLFADQDNDGQEEQYSDNVLVSIDQFGDDLAAEVSDLAEVVLDRLSRIDAGDVLAGLSDGLADLLSIDGLTIPILNIDLPDAAGLRAL